MKSVAIRAFMIVASLGVLFLAACATKPAPQAFTPRAADQLLTRDQAQHRAARVSNVHYDLSLNLPADNIPFTGTAQIHFDLSDAKHPLTVDFVEGEVQSVKVNGQDVAIDYNGVFITLPATALRKGHHNVEINYSHAYRRDGSGLHWFQDPEDGETYLFTQFEAWDFNQVFPGFDQPDLKSTYSLAVEVPDHWQVISATRETDVQPTAEGRKRWTFAKTQRFSTYLLPVHAGPYKVWEEQEAFRTPLRIFARKSYAEHIDVEEWFRITRQGFDFFEKYFDEKYPFTKYDQLAVPEFVFGAMENLGAVTFAERLQPRREKNSSDRKTMSIVIMHELAHHWFGNLVTMRWWDDIWLNESFADLMGHLATAKATDYTDAMVNFSTSRKTWGYEEDQWITTHPIVQDIPDTEAVMGAIDGITYAKGASSLIQLNYLLGEEVFRQGLVNYFDTFGWKNTELKDFIGTLGKTAKRDLSGWTDQWLMQSGVNALKTSYECADNKITSLDIEQLPANVSNALREHRLDVLLVAPDGTRTIVKAHLTGRNNLQADAVGATCPAFILPNVSDYTFAKILLDTQAVDYLKQHFDKFTNPIEQGMIWRSLWESVRAGEIAATDYLDLAIKFLPKEQNAALLQTQLVNVKSAYDFLVIRPFVRTSAILSGGYRKQLESISWERYQASEDAVARAWFELWIKVLHTSNAQAAAKKLLEQSQLTLDDRWLLAGALVRTNDATGKQWVTRLAKEDKSANAQLNQLMALAQAPDPAIKQQWITEVQNAKTTYAFTQLRSIMSVLFPVEQRNLQVPLRNEITQPIPSLANELTPQLLAVYSGSMIPLLCSKEGEQELLQLAMHEDLPKTVVKVLKKMSQLESICVSIQTKLDEK